MQKICTGCRTGQQISGSIAEKISVFPVKNIMDLRAVEAQLIDAIRPGAILFLVFPDDLAGKSFGIPRVPRIFGISCISGISCIPRIFYVPGRQQGVCHHVEADLRKPRGGKHRGRHNLHRSKRQIQQDRQNEKKQSQDASSHISFP
jgi:hypothetical protein